MVDFINKELYTQDSVDKQLQITFDGGTITNTEIPSEQFELTESLSSDSQLVFGSCEASEIKFRIYNVFTPLKDKWLTVTQILNGDTENPLQIGRYKVFSDKPTADRNYRDVVAYDSMYDIIRADMSSWYNGLSFPMSLKQFRNAFFDYFEIDQEDSSLINDDMVVEKTINPEVLSGKDVIQSICEINGCFGNIGRDGKFQYITLKATGEGLYPAEDVYPSDDLVPRDSTSTKIDSSLYISCEYEDFITQYIDGVWIRQQEGDVGGSSGKRSGKENVYVIENNFLVYGKGTDELNLIADNVLSQIDEVSYRPFNAEVVGNPCFEVGDAIRLFTKYEVVETYILNRTLSGVQSLRDDISADGEENITENVNDIQSQIIQLKGKTNTLERTVEETKSTIIDLENGLQTQITQTADSIRSEVSAIEKSLQEQIDNSLGQYSGSEVPTVNNYPANQWTTTELKDKAIGSLYFVNSEGGNYAGFAYIWEKLSDGTYQWALLKDTEVTQALKELQYLQNKLAEEYSTTVEMNSAIEQTKESITSTVAKSTKSYDFSDFAGTISYYNYGHPLNNYPADETTVGKYYLDASTGTIYTCIYRGTSYGWFAVRTLPLVEENLRSEIQQTAESITATVENVEKGLQSQIEQTAESITSTIAGSQKVWDEKDYNISYYGYGVTTYPEDYVSIGEYYLDQESGKVYVCVNSGGKNVWLEYAQLESIQKSLESSIEQTAESIRLEVAEETNQLSSEIEQLAGQIVLSVNAQGKIVSVELSADPSTGSEFRVDADNIDLSANDVINLLAGGTINLTGKNINITSDNLIVDENGLRIVGGNIEGSNISASDTFKMLCYYSAMSSGFEPVITTSMSKTGSSGHSIILFGNENFDSAFLGLPYFFANGISYNFIFSQKNPTLGDITYLQMSEQSSTSKFIHCQTTLGAYGITVWESDTKLKDNITPTEKVALEKIKELDFIQFDWKDGRGHVDLGLSANQVENVISDAVYEVEQGEESEYETLKNIDTPTLTVYSLKAIQEMSKIIETQQKEIDTLKEQVSFLMEKLGGNLDG